MFPEATHDEQALQNFVRSLRVHALREFEAGARKAFVDCGATADAMPTRKDLRQALAQNPHQRWWSSMLRTTQEMLYDTVGPSVERQLPELIAKAKSLAGRHGSLRLDPDLQLPKYLTAVDIHCKPGSYQGALVEDDVFAGAEFDRTYRLYSMGLQGPDLDAAGWSLIAWIKQAYPDLRPRRILDMGCTVGHSTLPYAEAFGPEVEVHAIDVAAPCLRYAHARAAAMGRTIHFSQQNAERTDFEDGSFDLVVSHLLMHETSRAALRNVVKETHRLLRPGGVMAHSDFIRPDDLFSRYYADWMAHFNNEPFLGTIQDEDFEDVCVGAGFSRDACVVAQAQHRLKDAPPSGLTFLVVSGRR